jgi:hypothetical protein
MRERLDYLFIKHPYDRACAKCGSRWLKGPKPRTMVNMTVELEPCPRCDRVSMPRRKRRNKLSEGEVKVKVIIAGSRTLRDLSLVDEAVERSGLRGLITEVVSGQAPGIDTLGERWAEKHGIPVKPFPADWDNLTVLKKLIRTRPDGTKYNALAGINRNQKMAEYADAAILIWDGKSPGTLNMKQQMRSLGKAVFLEERGNCE